MVFPVALLDQYHLLPPEFLIFDEYENKLTVEDLTRPFLSVSLWSILPNPPNLGCDPGNNPAMGVGEAMDNPTCDIRT